MRGKVLLIDTVHPVLQEIFEKNDFQCDAFYGKSREELEKIIGNYDGAIIRSKIIFDKALMEKASNLKFIGRVGAGMENIDVAFAASKNILCFNSPEGNRDAVGEHALGILLCLLNKICNANIEVRKGIWLRESNWGTEIKGKTVGIIGYGNMGSAFAEKLKGFSCNVIAYDKYKQGFQNEFVKEVTLNQLFEQTDILSIHVPQTQETIKMVDATFINAFKKDIFLINTARGKIVNTEHLVEAMKTGKIKGVALDVLEYEKFSFEEINKDEIPQAFQYLINSDKAILTPHIAGWTFESHKKMAQFLAEKIITKFYPKMSIRDF